MKKRITEYKNIWGYVKDLFSVPEFRRYTFFEFRTDNPDFFKPYSERIAPKIDYDKAWKSDGERKNISDDPDNIYLHTNISYEDYQTEISVSHWNGKAWSDRNPFNRTISVDPSINPLKGLLKNNK